MIGDSRAFEKGTGTLAAEPDQEHPAAGTLEYPLSHPLPLILDTRYGSQNRSYRVDSKDPHVCPSILLIRVVVDR